MTATYTLTKSEPGKKDVVIPLTEVELKNILLRLEISIWERNVELGRQIKKHMLEDGG